MKKFLAIIIAITACVLFTACSKNKDSKKYDLTVVSPEYSTIYTYLCDNQSETDSIYNISAQELDETIDSLKEEELSAFKSVTIFSDKAEDENIKSIIKNCKKKNIPVIFVGGKVDEELLNSYDKAFNITVDYEYVGESFADMIRKNWTEKIIDRDKNKIMSFTVVNTEEYDNRTELMYYRIIDSIELLGVPTKQYPDVIDSLEQSLDYCQNNKRNNEVYITFSEQLLSSLHEHYSPVGESIEILGIMSGFENTFADDENMLVYFIDYNSFISAKNQLIKNLEEKNYPFDNFEYLTIGKTAYIQPYC